MNYIRSDFGTTQISYLPSLASCLVQPAVIDAHLKVEPFDLLVILRAYWSVEEAQLRVYVV